jgi:hypothetical protein
MTAIAVRTRYKGMSKWIWAVYQGQNFWIVPGQINKWCNQ